jgi:hypothetical protein
MREQVLFATNGSSSRKNPKISTRTGDGNHPFEMAL